jgi:hypothetical protein
MLETKGTPLTFEPGSPSLTQGQMKDFLKYIIKKKLLKRTTVHCIIRCLFAVAATFLLDESKRTVTTSNQKSLHTFLWGPGEGAVEGTFDCPKGGKFGYYRMDHWEGWLSAPAVGHRTPQLSGPRLGRNLIHRKCAKSGELRLSECHEERFRPKQTLKPRSTMAKVLPQFSYGSPSSGPNT